MRRGSRVRQARRVYHLGGHDVWDVAVIELRHEEPLGSRFILSGRQFRQAVGAVETGEEVVVVHTLHCPLGEVRRGQSLVDVRDNVGPVLKQLSLL